MQMRRRGEQPWKTDRARTLRANDTLAESRLWQALKARRLGGWKFVRLLPVGHFFLDFACREVKLAVEVDGATHSTEEERKRDEARSVILERDGWTIVRMQNVDVYESLDDVLDGLRDRLSELSAGNLLGAAPLPDPHPLAKSQGVRENSNEVIE